MLPFLGGCSSPSYVDQQLDPGLVTEIQALGDHNWIVIADQSFPLHTRRGVRTLLVDKEIPEVLNGVLNVIDSQQHVSPVFYKSRELSAVRNDDAPGIDFYRQQLDAVFQARGQADFVRELQHQSLSVILEDESKSFAVLVIKTRTALPYSAVFIELESGYWTPQKEEHLRQAIEPATA